MSQRSGDDDGAASGNPMLSPPRRPFTVAIVGRPNVGKSTLFNRLAGKRLAIVDDTPGVTRDWKAAPAELAGMGFTILDTAGLEDADATSLQGRMREATERALDLADLALFLVDARQGLTPMDHHFAELLRRREAPPLVVVANKAESHTAALDALEAWELGFGEPVILSAEHGEGLADLSDAIGPFYDAWTEAQQAEPDAAVPLQEGEDREEEAHDPTRPIQLAIVGRPNAGKSTLMNALLGEHRSLVGPEAGVTRDSISADWTWNGQAFRLVDTAGMRRKSRIEPGSLEQMSVTATLRVIRLAQAVILMLDGERGLDKQDLTIARHIIEEGRILVIAYNKWDLVRDKAGAMRELTDRLEISLPQIRGVPITTISAVTGQRLDRLLQSVMDCYGVWTRRISTGKLNQWLADLVAAHPPPMVRGRANRLRYISQINTRPPTFAVWCGHPKELPASYVRYLANGLRDDFGFTGVPLRILTRGSTNPYAPEGR